MAHQDDIGASIYLLVLLAGGRKHSHKAWRDVSVSGWFPNFDSTERALHLNAHIIREDSWEYALIVEQPWGYLATPEHRAFYQWDKLLGWYKKVGEYPWWMGDALFGFPT